MDEARQVHDQVPVDVKLLSNQWLCVVICNHCIGWTLFNLQLSIVDQVRYIKQLDIEVSCSFSRTGFTMVSQFYGTLVFLVHHVQLYHEPLCFDESSDPLNFADLIGNAV